MRSRTTVEGRPPPGAPEITTGQANRVWHVDGARPYILKHYTDRARAANEAAALTLLAFRGGPAPQLVASGTASTPAWTAQQAIAATAVAPGEFLTAVAEPLATVHSIPGPHAGRLAGAARHRDCAAYARDRLTVYAAAAPALRPFAADIERDLAALRNVQPRLLHHDLRPGHLVRAAGAHVLVDWELAAFGDPASDLARLSVRLRLTNPDETLTLLRAPGDDLRERLRLYRRLHLLADAALATDPDMGNWAAETLRAEHRASRHRR